MWLSLCISVNRACHLVATIGTSEAAPNAVVNCTFFLSGPRTYFQKTLSYNRLPFSFLGGGEWRRQMSGGTLGRAVGWKRLTEPRLPPFQSPPAPFLHHEHDGTRRRSWSLKTHRAHKLPNSSSLSNFASLVLALHLLQVRHVVQTLTWEPTVHISNNLNSIFRSDMGAHGCKHAPTLSPFCITP